MLTHRPLQSKLRAPGSEAGCCRLVPGPEGHGPEGRSSSDPSVLLSEVTPAPTALSPTLTQSPGPAVCRGAHLPPLRPLASAATLPSFEPHLSLLDQEEREKGRNLCRAPGLPSGEAAQPFQASRGFKRGTFPKPAQEASREHLWRPQHCAFLPLLEPPRGRLRRILSSLF